MDASQDPVYLASGMNETARYLSDGANSPMVIARRERQNQGLAGIL